MSQGDFEDYYGDSSSALGLNHRASVRSADETIAAHKSANPDRPSQPGPPVIVPLTADEARAKDAAELRYQEKATQEAENELRKRQEVLQSAYELYFNDFVSRGVDPKLAAEMAKNEVDVRFENVQSEAYRDFERRTRELIGAGYTAVDAMRIADAEQVNGELEPIEKPKDPYLGAPISEIGFDRRPTGGGSSNSRRSQQKTFPKRCRVPECTLQYCDHRDTASKSGRKPIGLEPKSRKKSIRITPTAESGFAKAGISEGNAMEILGQALKSGRTFEEVRASMNPQSDVA